MIEFVFEVISELILFAFLPVSLMAATVWIIWRVLETIDPKEVKSIQSFVTYIVVVVPFVMLFYGGMSILVARTRCWRRAAHDLGTLHFPLVR